MSKSTKTTSENKPPEWATPLFKESASEAQKLFASGVGGNTFTGSTVAPLSDATMVGVNQLAQAGQNWNTAGTRPLYQGIGAAAVSNPFQNALSGLAGNIKPQNVSTAGLTDIASGRDGITTESDYRKLLTSFGAPSSAEANLSGYASGEFLDPAKNPYFAPALQDQLDKTAAQVQSQFSGMGRYGSGANTGVLTDTLGDIRTRTFADQFNKNQDLQFAANNMIDATRQAAAGNKLAAVSGITGVQGQNLANRLGATGLQISTDAVNADRQLQGQSLQGNLLSNAGNLFSTGIGQATTAADRMAGLDQQNFQNRLTGANATLQAGGIVDQQAQRQLADEIAKWYAVDNQDWTRLGLLQAAASGSAGNYGTQVSTSRQPVGIGSILSGVGSLFSGKSDARLKENIVPVGYRDGHVLWEFTYKGSAEKFRGVMAQMIMDKRPDAVVMEADGFYAVDYAALGFPMERIG